MSCTSLRQKVLVALIQLAGSKPDKHYNLEHATELISKALTERPETKMVILPECFNAPYAVESFREYAEEFDERNLSYTVQRLADLACRFKITLIGGSLPELDAKSNNVYNTAVAFNEKGELIEKHRKVHLFDIDIPNGIKFKESATLTAGDKVTTVSSSLGVFGLGICYDMRFPELAMISARKGAFAMIYPGAFNTITGPLHWELLARARAIDNQIYTIACSPARDTSSSYRAYGHSMVVDPMGKVIAEAGEGEQILFAELDPEEIIKARSSIPITVQRRFDLYRDISK